MGLDTLLARLTVKTVTPDTPVTFVGYQRKPLQALIVTPVTPVTPEIIKAENKKEIIGTLSLGKNDTHLDPETSKAMLHRQPALTLRRVTQKHETTISPVALKWLQAHKQELRQAGWTGRELYRRNKSKGICWCALWDMPFLKVYLHDNGVIEFEAVIAGRDIIQTARPMHRARKN